MTLYDRRSIALAVSLSALAGYVDAAGFLTTGGFFVSFMSGNSTRLAIGLGEERYQYALLAAGVVLLFVLGVILGTLVSKRAGERRRKPAVLLLVFLLLAIASATRSFGIARFGTPLLLLAMGAENAVFQREGEISIGLTYMTGALVKLGQRVALALQGGPRFEWVPYALLWIGLVVGAVGGALAHHRMGRNDLWPAAVFALILSALSTRL